MTFDEIGKASYMALKTFRRNGVGVATPMWVVAEGGKLWAVTGRGSGKVKRIAHTSHVEVCVSDMRGTPKGAWVGGEARLIDDPAEATRVLHALRRKYGLQLRLFTLLGRRGWDVVVEISPGA